MKGSIFVIIAVGVFLGVVSVTVGGEVVVSTFDSGNENWTVVTTLNNSANTTWESSGGNHGGYASGQDIDNGAWSFSAPEKFLGPVSAAYGHTLSFDIAQLDPNPGSTGWVGLSGGGLVEYGLVHPFDGPDVALTWYNHVITLDDSGEWYKIVDPDIPTTAPATAAEILSVLQDLDALIISGEFADGIDTDIAGLDNVILVPEPVTIGLLMLGGLGMFRRRRSGMNYREQNLTTKKCI